MPEEPHVQEEVGDKRAAKAGPVQACIVSHGGDLTAAVHAQGFLIGDPDNYITLCTANVVREIVDAYIRHRCHCGYGNNPPYRYTLGVP